MNNKAVNIFLYNVVYIKCDFSKIKSYNKNEENILIASPYCLNELSFKNRCHFNAVHQINRDFHQIDPDEVEKIVSHYVGEYGAENVRLFTNEDSTQLVCAQLREKYNIPGIGYDKLLPFVNKVISKKQLNNVVKIPKFLKFDKNSYLSDKKNYINKIVSDLRFPMFAKPIDLVSSVETHRIDDISNLELICDRIAAHEYEFEIDEFIDGDLFHCDAMIIDGSVKFFMVGKCSFALARFFEGKPVGSIPIEDRALFERLQLFCEKVFKQLNCFSGAYHLEAFLDKNTKEFIFLEIGARTGGALITRVYEKIFGINIEETNYLIQMGHLKDVNIKDTAVFAGFLNFPNIAGRLQGIIKPVLDIESEFIEFVEKGKMLQQASCLLDMSCSIIFWDTSYEKVEKCFEALKHHQPLQLA
ncbi:MAG: hypothetical protein IT497_01220 [Ottowia sp.]|nr:hypothetical protein [Ottowia sp.]